MFLFCCLEFDEWNFESGEKKSLEDDGSRVPIHIVTTASQLPVEFLEPSPQTKLVIGFDCEGVDLCRNGTLCIMQVNFPFCFVFLFSNSCLNDTKWF